MVKAQQTQIVILTALKKDRDTRGGGLIFRPWSCGLFKLLDGLVRAAGNVFTIATASMCNCVRQPRETQLRSWLRSTIMTIRRGHCGRLDAVCSTS